MWIPLALAVACGVAASPCAAQPAGQPPDLVICNASDSLGPPRELHFYLATVVDGGRGREFRYAVPLRDVFGNFGQVRLVFDGAGRLKRFALPLGVSSPDCTVGADGFDTLRARRQAFSFR